MIKSTNSLILPVVQNVKKIGLVLSFLDVASRDKAQDLFDNNPAKNVFALYRSLKNHFLPWSGFGSYKESLT